jgi:hypothetical protein
MVAVAVVVVATAALFITIWMSGRGSNAGWNKLTASAPAEKPPEDGTKDGETPPDGAKKGEKKGKDSVDLDAMELGKDGRPVGTDKRGTASGKPQEKKPDKAEIAAKEKWFDASKGPAVGNNVSVAVKSAKLGRFIVAGRSKRGMGLKLTLQITNNIKNRRLKCEWNALLQAQPDSLLVDNFDQPNAYALKKIVPKSEDAIDPEDVLEVDLIFEKPIKTAKYLHLKLPGAIFNEPDCIKIEIPKEMITPADENEDEEPAQGPVDPNKLPPAPSDQPGPRKGIPGVDAPAGSEVPDLGLPEPKTRWQPRGGRDVELADAERGLPAAVREQRITDFDDDPATVERYGQSSSMRDPDRRGSRHAVR